MAGLGQVIKGDAVKGLKIMLWFYLGFPMIIFGSLLLNAYLFLACLAIFVIVYPVLLVFNIIDAYSAQTGPAYRPAQRQSLARGGRSVRARRRA